MEIEPLLSARDVALLIGKSERWVRAQANAGVIPSLRFGRTLRFERAAIGDYVSRCKSPARVERVETYGTFVRPRRAAKRLTDGYERALTL